MDSLRLRTVLSHVASSSSRDFGESTGEATEPEPGVREDHVMAAARDGVRLSCALTFPTEAGQGPWPVLVQFRYAGDGSAPRQAMAQLARSGFVVGFCLFRGVHSSEGKYEGYHTQAKDGHDVVEWLSKQPFCTGQVVSNLRFSSGLIRQDGQKALPAASPGFRLNSDLALLPQGTFGSSQAGYAQNLLAGQAPPSLVAQYMIDTGMSLYHEAFFQGGGGKLGPLGFGGGTASRPGPFLSPGRCE